VRDRRRQDGVTIYEDCFGTCPIALEVTNLGASAVTHGHFIFGEGDVRGKLFAHRGITFGRKIGTFLFSIK
jgi:hypothetical protein